MQRPHVFPYLSMMNPLLPHVGPQEFFITQLLFLTPTKRAAKLRRVLQSLNTPEEYLDQLVASTATETGLSCIAVCNPLHVFIFVDPEILNDPESLLQVCLMGT